MSKEIRKEGYYWVRTTDGSAIHIAEWMQTDWEEWRWAITGCSLGFPDEAMTPLHGPLVAPEQ